MYDDHIKDIGQKNIDICAYATHRPTCDRLHVVVEELVDASRAVRAHEVHEGVSPASRAHWPDRTLHHGLLES